MPCLGLFFAYKVQSQGEFIALPCGKIGKKKMDFLHASLTFFNANNILQQDQIYPRAPRKNLRGERKVLRYYGKIFFRFLTLDLTVHS